MLDCITYSKDVTKLGDELISREGDLIHIDENGKGTFDVDKTPVFINEANESIALIRIKDTAIIEGMEYLTILSSVATDPENPKAAFEALFADETKTVIYERVCGHKIPFGVFA